MGVYAVSWSLTRQVMETEDEETWEFQPMLQIVKNAHSKQEAASVICDAFEHTDQFREGWNMTGPPAVLHIDAEVIADWTPYIDPLPANKPKRPDYLKPVDD